MLIYDEELYNRARSEAGMDIHDVYGATYLYRWYTLQYNKDIERGRTSELEKYKATSEKYERICRSFLVTGDIKESKRLVEEALEQGK